MMQDNDDLIYGALRRIGRLLLTRRNFLGWGISRASKEADIDRGTLKRMENPTANRLYGIRQFLQYLHALGLLEKLFEPARRSIVAMVKLETFEKAKNATNLLRLLRSLKWVRWILVDESGKQLMIFGEFPDADALGMFIVKILPACEEDIKETMSAVGMWRYKNDLPKQLDREKTALGIST